jgi:short-subunit dehydrogenase
MWVGDLADTETAERLALGAWDAFGHLDCLVNNAGVPLRRHTTDLDFATVDWVMRVNFLSPARMTMALLPRMLARGSGMVLNVSSLVGRLGNANEAAYSASKFALCGWSEATAVDLWDSSIEVRLVIPGPIDTEIWNLPGNEDPLYDGPKISAEEMAAGIVAALRGHHFELYLPDLKAVVQAKTADPDTFLAAMSQMRRARPEETS